MNFIKDIISKLKFRLCLQKAKFSARNVLVHFDSNWFKDKRVAIVGGADSVLKEKLGDYIDGFDVVVRINKGVEIIGVQSDYVGTKTDVLFHSFHEIAPHLGGSPITPELWQQRNVKMLLFALNYEYGWNILKLFLLFLKNTKRKCKFSQLPKDLYLKNLEVVQPNGPTTGFAAINTVFNCQPKELYITGITFFKTPNNAEYRIVNDDTLKKTPYINNYYHDAELEYQHVKSLYLQHKEIIKPDNTLEQIFRNN